MLTRSASKLDALARSQLLSEENLVDVSNRSSLASSDTEDVDDADSRDSNTDNESNLLLKAPTAVEMQEEAAYNHSIRIRPIDIIRVPKYERVWEISGLGEVKYNIENEDCCLRLCLFNVLVFINWFLLVSSELCFKVPGLR